VSADRTVAHFLGLGMTPEEAESRARLVDRVSAAFEHLVGNRPCWRWFVPGRIEVFGKHTDYAGGRSLLAAVPRGFAIAAAPRNDGLVRVMDVRYDASTVIDPGDGEGALKGWASYVQVVARRFARNFPGADLGLDLALASDLPRAAGLSSSSALVVGIGTALARRGQLTPRPEWRAEIKTVEDLAWYLGCVENGLDYRGLAGTAGVGTHGGSEDHTAILGCHAGHLSQYRFVPVAHQGDVPLPHDWSFVIAASGVHADKAGSVRDQYNRASLATRALLDCWNETASTPARSLAEALAGDGALPRLYELIASRRSGAYTAKELGIRLSHFVAEDGRVPDAARAFAIADARTLATLSRDSQREADEWLGNQTPETRALAAAAFDTGAIAASSFGAGFGGSVWALVPSAEANRFAGAWLAEYRRRCPWVSGEEWFAARPGPAVSEVVAEQADSYNSA
jgi:galactokinase